jgi:glycerophosphoryl diester phosphodiesterase
MPHRHHLRVIVSAHDGYPRFLHSGADFIEVDIRRDAGREIILAHDAPQPGDRYPTLEHVLAEIDGQTGLHLDLKESGFENELLAMVLERLPPDKVVVTPDFDDSVRAIKERFPGVRVSPIDFVAVDHDKLGGYSGSRLPIWVWTVDAKRSMQRYMKDARIEAIITNRPDLALKLRKARS